MRADRAAMGIEQPTAAKRLMAMAVRRNRDEAGFTLIEFLVAMTMSVVVVGAAVSMLITALKDQPNLSKRAQNVSEARWVLERLTREIRQGVVVDEATSSLVSFKTYVRRTTCGGSEPLAEGSPAIKCEVTYTCTTTSCKRIEAAPGVYTGAETTVFSGIDRNDIFCYVASAASNPSSCGTAPTRPGETTYIGVKIHIPNPNGGSGMTISDGATLSNATLIK